MVTLRAGRPDVFAATHVTSSRAARLLATIVDAPLSVITGKAQGKRFKGVERRPGDHKAVEYGRYFQAAGVPIDLSSLEFPPLVHGTAPSATRRIVLAPAVGTASEQHKKWPEDAFVQLAHQIAREVPDARIELFASPPERQVLERIFSKLDSFSQQKTSIRTPSAPADAAIELVGASCVVTSCSGASHLAAWADAPIVGIYGPTNPSYTGPFSRKLRVVRKNWRCSPCYRPDFVSGCATPDCMTEIDPREVLNAVHATLRGDSVTFLGTLLTTRASSIDRRTPVEMPAHTNPAAGK